MNQEYIKLTPEELNYGKKSILEFELQFLNLIKRVRAYKQAKRENNFLKIELERKTEQLKNTLDKIEKTLPKASEEKKTPHQKQNEESQPKKLQIDEEIEQIRKKLLSLQEA